MKVTFAPDTGFICKCSFEKRHLPRDAGFHWSGAERHWYTRNPEVAARLNSHCDEHAKKQISKFTIEVTQWTGGISVPEGEKLFDFQETAARFALSRNRSYLGLDPGLGKTPILAAVTATLQCSTIYICPPFLTRNTEAEFKRWAPKLKVSRFDLRMQFNGPEVVIIPDSMITKKPIRDFIEEFVRWHRAKGSVLQLAIDEAHRYKNDMAQRTRAVLGSRHERGLADLFDRIVYASGTPMPNRPMELFPILAHSAPATIDYMNKFEYGRKFCAGHKNQFGWDFSGASNLPLLKERVLGPFMLRYRKAEVLKELPPKTEDMVLIGDDLSPALADIDRDILKSFSPEDLMQGRFSNDEGEIHISTYRKELGVYKAKSAAEYIRYLLEEGDESLLVFGIHTDVIATLEKELEDFNPLVITGQTPLGERHEIVSKFQNEDSGHRLFIGNIQAAGVGLTLTKATRVVFAEFSWVPSDNDQASDRAHRIGQQDNVFVQYLVFKNSIDRTVLETILRKKKVTEAL